MSAEKVVGLHGVVPPSTGATVLPDVVEMLDDLTAEAASGIIHGVAFVAVHSDGAVIYGASGGVVSYSLLGALECLKQRVAADISESAER